jgi:hypothetical protein
VGVTRNQQITQTDMDALATLANTKLSPATSYDFANEAADFTNGLSNKWLAELNRIRADLWGILATNGTGIGDADKLCVSGPWPITRNLGGSESLMLQVTYTRGTTLYPDEQAIVMKHLKLFTMNSAANLRIYANASQVSTEFVTSAHFYEFVTDGTGYDLHFKIGFSRTSRFQMTASGYSATGSDYTASPSPDSVTWSDPGSGGDGTLTLVWDITGTSLDFTSPLGWTTSNLSLMKCWTDYTTSSTAAALPPCYVFDQGATPWTVTGISGTFNCATQYACAFNQGSEDRWIFTAKSFPVTKLDYVKARSVLAPGQRSAWLTSDIANNCREVVRQTCLTAPDTLAGTYPQTADTGLPRQCTKTNTGFDDFACIDAFTAIRNSILPDQHRPQLPKDNTTRSYTSKDVKIGYQGAPFSDTWATLTVGSNKYWSTSVIDPGWQVPIFDNEFLFYNQSAYVHVLASCIQEIEQAPATFYSQSPMDFKINADDGFYHQVPAAAYNDTEDILNSL